LSPGKLQLVPACWEAYIAVGYYEYYGRGVARREPAIEFICARYIGWHECSDAAGLAATAEHQLIVISRDVNTMSANAYPRIRAGTSVVGLLMASKATQWGGLSTI
jgi:hypothetical protein